jgi:hypothetical protein
MAGLLDRGLRAGGVALLAVVVTTVAVGGGRLLFRDDGQRAAGQGESGVSSGGVGSATPYAGGEGTNGDGTAEPSAAGGEVIAEPPAGFHSAADPQGFTVQVRDGWTRREDPRPAGTVIFYETPGGESMLQIYRISEPDLTPYEALTSMESQVTKPGYERIRLDSNAPYVRVSSDAAEFEYRVPRADGGMGHALARAFVADDGGRWVLRVAGPDGEWGDGYAEAARVAAASFCPDGYCGGAGGGAGDGE